MEDIILVGYGGHAKSVADCIERQGKYHIVGYTELKEHISSYQYLGTDEVLYDYFHQGIVNAAVCIGYLGQNNLRENLYSKLKRIGFSLPVIADPSAVISDTTQIGEGTFIGKGAIINAYTAIGNMVIVNTQAIVEHDCSVDNFSHIAVGAVLCGGVHVAEGCLIGANATVLQTLRIGERSIVAAGTVISKNVGDGKIVRNKLNIQIGDFPLGG